MLGQATDPKAERAGGGAAETSAAMLKLLLALLVGSEYVFAPPEARLAFKARRPLPF